MEHIYKWLGNIAYYMILITVFMQVVPNAAYKRYIRLFTGFLLILLLLDPIFSIFGAGGNLAGLYDGSAYEDKIEEIEESSKYLEEVEISEYIPETFEEEEEQSGIRVEEVRIGR